jgi:iron-sulfur cluster assembly protein
VNSEPVATGAEPAAQRSVNDLAPVNALEGARERTPKNGIAITDAAVTYAKEKLAKRGTPDAAIRLGIKGGGCSGFSYVIQFEDDPPKPRDYLYEADGVRFIVDKKSFVYLAGTTFDYEKTLMFQGFKFRNPQEAASCGCGHSFTVK